MPELVSGTLLNVCLEDVIRRAKKRLILISPYIKIHKRLIDELKLQKKKNPNLFITIVFGKNDDDFAKSFHTEHLNFLKDFANIEIRYKANLHAKFYANETLFLLSSMNLYDYSQDNNVEFGVVSETKMIKDLLSEQLTGYSFERDTKKFFNEVIETSDLLYKTIPNFEKKNLGLSSTYINSDIVINKLDNLIEQQMESKSTNNFTPQIHYGYCIRTGEKIAFNIKKPFTDKAFSSWERYSNENYKEKYCHFSGEPSNGETSMKSPVLNKNWKESEPYR